MEALGLSCRKRLTMERTPRFRVRACPFDKDFIIMTPTEPRTSFAARIALLTGIACVACCAIPLLGLAIGSAAIAGLAVYSETAAMAVAAIGVGILLFKRLTRQSGPTCAVDSPCGPNAPNERS